MALTPPFVTAISRVRTLYYCVDLITEVTLLSAQLSLLLFSQAGSLRPVCCLDGTV